LRSRHKAGRPRRRPHPVASVLREDVATFAESMTVQEVLDEIRERGIGERIAYFYVVDGEGRLLGVAPTRRLLTADPGERLSHVMTGPVTTVPLSATVWDACEMFVRHRFLALPVVDEHGRLVGVVDVETVAGEQVDFGDTNSIFETIGFRISQVRDASPFRAFRFRFPWLMSTIAGGVLCALLVSAFEFTLAQSLVLAFFLTLVLGLGESVSIQSATVTILALRTKAPTMSWYLRAFRREVGAAFLLGLACGAIVGAVAWLWRGEPKVSLTIAGSLVLIISGASTFGLSIPALLHALRLDPKIAAGPITLAITDLSTILIYFGLAALLL